MKPLEVLVRQVVMSVSTKNSYVIRQGKSRGIYQPGKGQLFEASFSNFQIETGIIKRIGYFNSTTTAPYDSSFDGFFLESNGDNNLISFQIWKSGTNILSATTNTWLTSDYDVNNISWTRTQLMFTDFQWLGVGRVRFGLVIDGLVKTFVTKSGSNDLPYVYMKSPNQPVRYELRQLVDSVTGTLNMICSQISLEGSVNNLQKSASILAFTPQTKATQNIKYPLIGYRLNSTYNGANITLSDIQVMNTTTPSKADYYITIELNPRLSTSANTFNNISDTPIDYSIATGQTVTSSGHILASFLGSGSSPQVDSFQFKDNMLRPGINVDGSIDEVWICVSSPSNSQDYRSIVNLSYFD